MPKRRRKPDPRTRLIGRFVDALVIDPPAALRLLKRDPTLIDARWPTSETVLHFLAVENHTNAVALLIRHGADVNAANGTGCTPLRDVVILGSTDMVRLLLAAGADPNVDDGTGSILSFAATLEIADLLREAGAEYQAWEMS